MTHEEQYEMLIDSLRLLACDARDQVEFLPDFVLPTEEISSYFGESFLLLPQLIEGGFVGSEASDAIRRVDSWFEGMPTDGSIADPSALNDSDFWIHARVLAQEALLALDERVKPPKFRHIAWVR